MNRRISQKALTCAVLFALAGGPASASDTTDAGVLAALGLGAASGKTTLGEGAGAIETAIYAAEAYQKAGTIIAREVRAHHGSHKVIVLARTDVLDLISPDLLLKEIQRTDLRVKLACPPPSKTKGGRPDFETMQALTESITTEESKALLPPVEASDLAGAFLTDTAIGGVPLTPQDRLILMAVVMNASGQRQEFRPDDGNAAAASFSKETDVPEYVLPGELVSIPPGSLLYKAYGDLLQTLKDRRAYCSGSTATAVLDDADKFVAGLSATDKGPPPLASAMAAEAMAGNAPYVLRLSADDAGGTTLARSGVIYALGWPNAVTVGAGLVVSYRLMDPAVGSIVTAGVVRCAVRQTNIKGVPLRLAHRPALGGNRRADDIVCDYRVGG